MTPQLRYVEEPTTADRVAIAAPLMAYNMGNGPPLNDRPLVILLQNDDDVARGGLWGETVYDWLHIELLVVPEAMRGMRVGASLMHRAEEIAKERGCVGVWLDTFAFQARAFYEKLGYQVFGEIADHPKGSARYFLMKRF
jgi:GNAT superfamily N-acetyltransferase